MVTIPSVPHQPITTGGVTYHEQPWHKDCFLCTGCKQQLSGQRFTSRDDFAYCLNCFCNLYAKKCASCTTPISGTQAQLCITIQALTLITGPFEQYIIAFNHTQICVKRCLGFVM